MMKQAITINNWGKNVYVKVPVINSKKQFTGKLIKRFKQKKDKIKYHCGL